MLGFSRALVSAALAALSLAPAVAHAQTREAARAEIKLVRDCVEKNAESGRGQQCIGIVAKRCGAKPENQGGLSRADCYKIEEAIWTVVLGEAEKALSEELDDDQKTKLKETQQAWTAARTTTCEFYYHKIQGSMSVSMTASCALNETARRALWLKTMAGL